MEFKAMTIITVTDVRVTWDRLEALQKEFQKDCTVKYTDFADEGYDFTFTKEAVPLYVLEQRVNNAFKVGDSREAARETMDRMMAESFEIPDLSDAKGPIVKAFDVAVVKYLDRYRESMKAHDYHMASSYAADVRELMEIRVCLSKGKSALAIKKIKELDSIVRENIPDEVRNELSWNS